MGMGSVEVGIRAGVRLVVALMPKPTSTMEATRTPNTQYPMVAERVWLEIMGLCLADAFTAVAVAVVVAVAVAVADAAVVAIVVLSDVAYAVVLVLVAMSVVSFTADALDMMIGSAVGGVEGCMVALTMVSGEECDMIVALSCPATHDPPASFSSPLPKFQSSPVLGKKKSSVALLFVM